MSKTEKRCCEWDPDDLIKYMTDCADKIDAALEHDLPVCVEDIEHLAHWAQHASIYLRAAAKEIEEVYDELQDERENYLSDRLWMNAELARLREAKRDD